MKPNAAGGTSRARSSCAPSITAARTASSPTSSSARLALLLLRVAEVEVGDTWRNIRNELDRMHLVTLATNHGTIAQRTELTPGQRHTLNALKLPEPPRFYDFAPAPAPATAPAAAGAVAPPPAQ